MYPLQIGHLAFVIGHCPGRLVVPASTREDEDDENENEDECGNMNQFETRNVWRVSQDVLQYQRQGGKVQVGGQLKIVAQVKNLAPVKIVGVRYTSDDWLTWTERDGCWSGHDATTDTDQFVVHTESTLAPGAQVKYALYYKVNDSIYWDNNNSRNYSVQF